jgi:hypothetical protein
LLGGLMAGPKVIGPLISEPATPEAWKAAPSLPINPIRNTYVPLELICTEILQVFHEELKWLRLDHHVVEERYISIGHSVRVPKYERYSPWSLSGDPLPGEPSQSMVIMDVKRVTLDHGAHVGAILNRGFFETDLKELRNRYIGPMGCALADHVTHQIKLKGGGDTMVMSKQEMPKDVARALVVTDSHGLSLRGVEYFDILMNERKLQIDVLYGVG